MSGEDDGEFEVFVAPPGGAGGDAAGPARLELRGPKPGDSGGWGACSTDVGLKPWGWREHAGPTRAGGSGTRLGALCQVWRRTGQETAERKSGAEKARGGSGKDPGRGAGDCGQSGG